MLALSRRLIRFAVGFVLAAGVAVSPSTLLSQGDPYFSGAVILMPPPLPSDSDSSGVFEDWGITFQGGSGQVPHSGKRTVFFWMEGPRLEVHVVENGKSGEDAGPLIMDFESPASQVSLTLAAAASVTATARFFDNQGTQLGERTALLPANYGVVHPPLYIRDEAGRAISRIEVEYSDAGVPEALFIMRVGFVDPPVFRRCVAQFAHGRLPQEERQLQTQLSITSPVITYWDLSDVTATVSLELRDPSGEPLPAILDGQTNSQFQYTLQNVQSKIVRTTGSVTELDRGYACVTSDYPVELAAVYRVLDSTEKPASETGVQGAIPGYRFFGIVQKSAGEETNTALALANVSDQEATVSLTLYLPAFRRHKAELILAPGEQEACFIDELVSEVSDVDLEGTVEIVSDQPLVGTIVRTIKGVVSASLPLGRSQAPAVK